MQLIRARFRLVLFTLGLFLTVFVVFIYQDESSNILLFDQEKVVDVKSSSAVTLTVTNSSTISATKSLADIAKEKILEFYRSIESSESKYYSQNREDGVIKKLNSLLNIQYGGFYVEFGTENARECNTRYLREHFNWKGLLMDGSNSNPGMNLHKEKIMHSNILELFEKHKINDTIDIFSEDTDYADYWIVDKVLTKYHPKIVIHEINQQDACVTVPKPSGLVYWDGSNFHGASVCAFQCLAKKYNYTMVYCESAGVNCFWMRDDLLAPLIKNVTIKEVQSVLTPGFLHKRPSFVYRSTGNQWLNVNC